MKERNVPVDFFSWHRYAYEPAFIAETAKTIRRLLDDAGFTEAESINDEWNYVKGWTDDEWLYSLRTEKNLKGASFILATMCACSYADVDMLMYYDARPSSMNGMFATDFVCDCLKGYYPFKMFNELYKLDKSVQTSNDRNIFSCAAIGEDRAAIALTHFCDDESTPAENIKLTVNGFSGENGVKASYYLLDKNRDLELVKEEILSGDSYATVLSAELYSSYLVILNKING